MVRKRSPSNKDTQQPKIDDLKLIKGIGPVVEQRLLNDGIYTFAHLAAFLPSDIAARLTGLSGMTAERIIREDWIGQARKLAAESISSEVQEEVETSVDTKQVAAFTAIVEPMPPIEDAHTVSSLKETQKETQISTSKEQLHLATFTVEFLLDENNYVHNARVMHLESQREHSWSSWPNTELVDFLRESVELNIQSDELVPPHTEEHVHPAGPAHAAVEVAESKPLSIPETDLILKGQLHLREMEIEGIVPDSPSKTLARDTPFDVRLTLDLSELKVPSNVPLNYIASIYGKSSRTGLVLGQRQGTLITHETVTLNVERNMLSEEGIYHLAAQVIVGLPNTKLRIRPGTTALIDGGQIQVY